MLPNTHTPPPPETTDHHTPSKNKPHIYELKACVYFSKCGHIRSSVQAEMRASNIVEAELILTYVKTQRD